MTTDEAKQAHIDGCTVIYNGGEYTIDHIKTFYSRKEKSWRNSLCLAPVNGANSVTVALMRDCELKGG